MRIELINPFGLHLSKMLGTPIPDLPERHMGNDPIPLGWKPSVLPSTPMPQSTLGRDRTCDLLVRSQMFCSAKLRAYSGSRGT